MTSVPSPLTGSRVARRREHERRHALALVRAGPGGVEDLPHRGPRLGRDVRHEVRGRAVDERQEHRAERQIGPGLIERSTPTAARARRRRGAPPPPARPASNRASTWAPVTGPQIAVAVDPHRGEVAAARRPERLEHRVAELDAADARRVAARPVHGVADRRRQQIDVARPRRARRRPPRAARRPPRRTSAAGGRAATPPARR